MDDLEPPDIEAIVRDEPEDTKLDLRLWLRLLSCTNLISGAIRRNLRGEFDVTLPRFDLMAQLYREPDGLRLGELSRRMMVTNGNITGLVDRLVEEGMILREVVPEDRRAMVVRLTPGGARTFAKMAAAHESWLHQMFRDMGHDERDDLLALLEILKRSVRRNTGDAAD